MDLKEDIENSWLPIAFKKEKSLWDNEFGINMPAHRMEL